MMMSSQRRSSSIVGCAFEADNEMNVRHMADVKEDRTFSNEKMQHIMD